MKGGEEVGTALLITALIALAISLSGIAVERMWVSLIGQVLGAVVFVLCIVAITG